MRTKSRTVDETRLALMLVTVLALCLYAAHAGTSASGQPGSQAESRLDADGETGAWPSFRGPGASGVAEQQHLPDRWNGETGENIL